jgi:hypothetical protein
MSRRTAGINYDTFRAAHKEDTVGVKQCRDFIKIRNKEQNLNSRIIRSWTRGLRVLLVVAVWFALSCSKPRAHSVTISWHPSVPVQGVQVAGYNLYRSTVPGGPYVKIASGIAGTTYDDMLVNSGRTYYYVVTTIDSVGRESPRSEEISAAVP